MLKFLACFLAIVATTAAEEIPSAYIIQTRNGPVQGTVKQSRNPRAEFVSFQGLRYADPPPRFEPANPLTKTWTTVKNASAPGSICLQMTGGSDDCLFLNVHVPLSALEDNFKRLPVMFWIHGGGYTFGEGHTYGAELLMENENVILVTINYRLGAVGFISMENDTAFTANNGLRDMVMALKWTRDNIAAFHGDPDKVTIFGESAGSGAVHQLLMSPCASGLFQRAILQSGSHCFWSHQKDPRANAVALAKALNCPNTQDAWAIRKCLENTEGSALVKAQAGLNAPWLGLDVFVPTFKEPQGNAFFVREPSSFFTYEGQESQYVNKVPVMMGVNRDEGSVAFVSFILAVPGLLDDLNVNWTQLAPTAFLYGKSFFPKNKLESISSRLRSFYLGNDSLTRENLEPLVKLYTDILFLLPMLSAMQDMVWSGYTVYPYMYSYVGPAHYIKKFGVPSLPNHAAHADELQHLFEGPVFGANGAIKPNSEDERFSKRMVKVWTGFADKGVPELDWGDNTIWSPAQPKADGGVEYEMVELKEKLGKVRPEVFREKRDFWAKLKDEVLLSNNAIRAEMSFQNKNVVQNCRHDLAAAERTFQDKITMEVGIK